MTQPQTRRVDRRRRRSAPFKLLVALAALIVVIVLVFGIEAGISRGKVHPGVSVAGIELGGLSEADAAATLGRHVATIQASPITLTGGGKTWTVMPEEAGAQFDAKSAVAAAMEVTRSGNIFSNLGKRWKLYFTEVDLPLVGAVDAAKLDALLAEVSRALNLEPVSAAMVVEDGDIKVIEGRKGQAVDQATLREELSTILVSPHSTEVRIPLVAVEPDVMPEDYDEALETARTMIGAPVTLKNGDNSWTLSPDEMISYMEFSSERANGLDIVMPRFSATLMDPFFTSIASLVAKEPVDATFGSDGNKAWVIPAQAGERLDPKGTTEALTLAALEKTGRTAEIVVEKSEADFTTEEAESWGIKDRLASYETTPYAGSSNRQNNVRITTKYMENVFLAPGEIYDTDKQIGPRTAERGYRLAPGIIGGGILEDVLGGGICQVSTTLFNAVFEAGLEILERHNHSVYIDHYPDGRDATIAGGFKNMRFRNDTEHYIWIRGRSDGIRTRFTIYGTDDGREVQVKFSGFSFGAARTEEIVEDPSLAPGERKTIRSGQSARSCSVTRTVTMPDGTVRFGGPQVFKSYYPMMTKLIHVAPSTTTTVTTVRPTTTTGFGLPPDITAPVPVTEF